MILINLLPEEMRPVKRTPLPYLGGMLLLLLVLAGIGILYLKGQASLASEKEKLANIEAELKTLEAVREDYKRLKAEEERLRAKVKVIREILADRIVWSEQIDSLVNMTPDNFWYDRIWVSLEEEQSEVAVIDEKTQKVVIDPKTKKEKVEVIKVKVHRLHISGYAMQDENGEAQLSPLLNRIKENTEFAKRFTAKPPQVDDTDFLEQNVRKFILDFTINPATVEEEQAPAAAGAAATGSNAGGGA